MTASTPISGLNSIVVTCSITNMNGFIVMGVLAGTFNSTSQTLPSTINIKNGSFTSTQSLISAQMVYATQNYNVTLSFPGLTANTTYSLFYFCTAEDPQMTSLSSSVGVITAQTLQVLVININWGSSMGIVCLVLLGVILG